MASAATHTPFYDLVTYAVADEAKRDAATNGVLRVGQCFHAFRHGLELRGGQPEALPQFPSNISGIGDVRRVRREDRRRGRSQLRCDGLQDFRAVAGFQRLQRPRRPSSALAHGLERIPFVQRRLPRDVVGEVRADVVAGEDPA